MSSENVLNIIKENNVKFVEVGFTDTRDKEQQVSVLPDSTGNPYFAFAAMLMVRKWIQLFLKI